MEKEQPLKDSAQDLIDDVFKGSLPHLFGDDFNKGKITWKRLPAIRYDVLGRILVCHLLIENHIDKYIELSLPSDFDLEKARMSFSQKVEFAAKSHFMVAFNFVQAVKVLNKIRNSFSHDIQSGIKEDQIQVVLNVLNEYKKSAEKPITMPTRKTHTDVAIIEFFTNLFCAYFAGGCAMAAHLKANPNLLIPRG